jgi:hypothetical protein
MSVLLLLSSYVTTCIYVYLVNKRMNIVPSLHHFVPEESRLEAHILYTLSYKDGSVPREQRDNAVYLQI